MTEDPPSIISETEAERQHGIVANHTRMPNGELRFRLNASDGTGYVRTESVPGETGRLVITTENYGKLMSYKRGG